MITYKTKYQNYIADVFIPRNKTGKTIVLLPGLPRSSSIDNILSVFLNSGCVVIYPNYSGSFDSSGCFRIDQCIEDVPIFIDLAQEQVVHELYYGQEIKFDTKETILVGMSFGVIPAIFGLKDNVSKLILLSPALLYNQAEISKIIDFNFERQMLALCSYLRNAYPFTYRLSGTSFESDLLGETKLLKRNNIEKILNDINVPTLIIHGKEDSSINWMITDSLRKNIKNKLLFWNFPNVGHSLSSYDEKTKIIIQNFINKGLI